MRVLQNQGLGILTILLIILLIVAFGGFGHTGYRRGWYGGYNRTGGPVTGGWDGGGLGVFLLIVVLLLLPFGGHGTATY